MKINTYIGIVSKVTKHHVYCIAHKDKNNDIKVKLKKRKMSEQQLLLAVDNNPVKIDLTTAKVYFLGSDKEWY